MASVTEGAQPLVSVVIVSYNGRKHLKACLDSVLDQDFPHQQYEVVVLDNASSDGSADFVEQNYPTVRVLRFEHNYGPGEACRRAIPDLRGKYFAYLNQDTVAHRRWLPELVDVLLSHPEAGIVESNMYLPMWPEYKELPRDGVVEYAYVCDLNSFGVHDFRRLPVTPSTPPVPVLTAYGAGCIVNPQILDELGYWIDPDLFAYFDDIDLGLRVNAAGYKVLLAPQSVVYHDTDWHFKWDTRSTQRAFLSTRNTILVFYKISYASEFMVLLPRLLVGKLMKAGQLSRSPAGRVFHALAGMPLLLVSLIAALLKLPALSQRRKLTLSRRKTEPGWLVDRLLNPGWEPDATVWARGTQTVPSGNSETEMAQI